jgi:hypothetical protein
LFIDEIIDDTCWSCWVFESFEKDLIYDLLIGLNKDHAKPSYVILVHFCCLDFEPNDFFS